jgi:hypothetical protein
MADRPAGGLAQGVAMAPAEDMTQKRSRASSLAGFDSHAISGIEGLGITSCKPRMAAAHGDVG